MDDLGVSVVEWEGPVAMDTGAPDPLCRLEARTLWVAYLAFDPDFPGWGHPATEAYFARVAGDPYGVLRFDSVAHHQLGAPGDERMHEHPLWGRGLQLYSFHRVVMAEASLTRWIVTFHDDTLEVIARSAWASPMIFTACHKSALDLARAGT